MANRVYLIATNRSAEVPTLIFAYQHSHRVQFLLFKKRLEVGHTWPGSSGDTPLQHCVCNGNGNNSSTSFIPVSYF